MAKAKKSTKKFVKKHLGTELKKRNINKTLKRQRGKSNSKTSFHSKESSIQDSSSLTSSKKRIEELNVDEFLDGKFLDDIEIGIDDKKENGEKGLMDSDDEDEEEEDEGDEEEEDDEKMDQDDVGEQEFIDITPEEEEEKEEEGENLITTQNKKMKTEMGKHKSELELLKQKDPEFYKFLEEHDKDLLEFDDDDEDEDEDDFEDDDDDEDEDDHKKTKKKSKQISTDSKTKPASAQKDKTRKQRNLTTALIDTWIKSLKENPSYNHAKYMLLAFQSSCHYGDNEEKDKKNLNSEFNISSSHVFSQVMMFTLREMNDIMLKLLTVTEPRNAAAMDINNAANAAKKGNQKRQKSKLDVATLTSNPRWNRVKLLVKLYLRNCVHVLEQMTDASMIAFVLRRMKPSIPFFLTFPTLMKKLMKIIFHMWGEGEGVVPVVAIMLIRETCINHAGNWLDTCCKRIYRTYATNVKFMSGNSQSKVAFLGASVVEIYGLNPATSYMHAFVFIRQLALVLRNALTKATTESFLKVYNWQYMNCLEVWTRVLSSLCPSSSSSSSELQPLIYPLVQIIMGTARLLPSSQYLPLHLHCVRMLNHLSSSTGCYIPLSPLLLDMLQVKEFRMTPISSREKPYDLRAMLKVSKSSLRSKVYQEDCMDEIFFEFCLHFSLFAFSISFPELAVFPLLHLRKFMKETKVEKFKKMAKQLIDHVERNVEYIKSKRAKVDFSPKDFQQVESFLQDEKKTGNNSLVHYARSLLEKSKQKRAKLTSNRLLVKNEMENEGDAGDIKKRKKQTKEKKMKREEREGEGEGGEGEGEGEGGGEGEGMEIDEETFRAWAPKKKSAEKKKKKQVKIDVEMDDASRGEEEEGDKVEDLVLSDDEDEDGEGEYDDDDDGYEFDD